ncbi:MAG TPA: hypothetical protein VMF89_15990, partial [Polyangiales bacterium]|nr:hypothetical protein [Polyangiales bacterium]
MCTTACSLIYREEIQRMQCSEQSDCMLGSMGLGTPLVCMAGACQAATCVESAECPAGSTCISSMCVGTRAGAETAVACTSDA